MLDTGRNVLNIGYSTGVLLEAIPDVPNNGNHLMDRIDKLLEISQPGGNIEINIASPDFLNAATVDGLISFWKSRNAGDTFGYVSIHSPGRIIYDDSPIASESLDLIQKLVEGLGAQTVIFHPHQIDLAKADQVLDRLNGIACVENMDKGMNIARGAEELREYIEKGFGLVLDVNHAGPDEEGRLVSQGLIESFPNNIHHIHVSGTGVMGENNHSHRFYDNETDLRNLEPIRELVDMLGDVNIIHEGIMSSTENLDVNTRLKNELLKVAGKILE